MRRQAIGLVVLLAALATPLWAQEKAPEDEKLFGTWVLTMVQVEDKSIPVPDGQQSFAFAKGGKVTLKSAGKDAEDGMYVLGAVKKPRDIDITGPAKDGKSETVKAIYELDGDTFKMAFPLKGPLGERPTAVDPKMAGVMIFKRQK